MIRKNYIPTININPILKNNFNSKATLKITREIEKACVEVGFFSNNWCIKNMLIKTPIYLKKFLRLKTLEKVDCRYKIEKIKNGMMYHLTKKL